MISAEKNQKLRKAFRSSAVIFNGSVKNRQNLQEELKIGLDIEIVVCYTDRVWHIDNARAKCILLYAFPIGLTQRGIQRPAGTRMHDFVKKVSNWKTIPSIS